MRGELLKRLDKLETMHRPITPLRIVRKFIGADNGNALPWNPTWAMDYRHGPDSRIERRPDETAPQFEARAAEHFRDHRQYSIG